MYLGVILARNILLIVGWNIFVTYSKISLKSESQDLFPSHKGLLLRTEQKATCLSSRCLTYATNM